MNDLDIDMIILDLLSGETLTPEQQEYFDTWYADPADREQYDRMAALRAGVYAVERAAGTDMSAAWSRVKPPQRRTTLRRVMSYAAVIVVAAATFAIIRMTDSHAPAENATAPGEQVAVLTLSTGERVELSGTVGQWSEEGIVIAADSENGLVYMPQEGDAEGQPLLNTIHIPRTGEYKLCMADGTRVWINSETTLRYPVNFTGRERQVEIVSGEAYFEVAHDPGRPFIVKTDSYDVRVTGTQFNVRAYNAGRAATTLVEGSVQLEKSGEVCRLSPGQQGVVTAGGIAVEDVDVSPFVGWKEGVFLFSQRPLSSIMEDIERWFDVEVEYDAPQTAGLHFSARFSRTAPLDEIISILGRTGKVTFELDGRRLRVSAQGQ